MHKRFERVDMNCDGLLSNDEMMWAHNDRIGKMFVTYYFLYLKIDDNDNDNEKF